MPDLKQPIHADDYQQGHPNAPVQIVIYADFANPETIPLNNQLETLLEQSSDDVLLVYRHFPQTMKHPLAYAIAQALEAAAVQGKFWAMLKQVLSNQTTITDGALRQFARDIGVDVAQFEDDMSSGAINKRIDADIQTGKDSAMQDAPMIFINGTHQDDFSLEDVYYAINNA